MRSWFTFRRLILLSLRVPLVHSSNKPLYWKAAGATAKKVPAAPAKYVKVVDVDNDGYLDIVVAGGMVSYSPGTNKVIIYFGSEQTKTSCDYSAAQWTQVGHEDPIVTGAVLALDGVAMPAASHNATWSMGIVFWRKW